MFTVTDLATNGWDEYEITKVNLEMYYTLDMFLL